MGYSRRTLNYPKRITLSNLTRMMSMADLIAINVETLRIYGGCSLEKEFIKLIHTNPWMIIITNSQVDWFMSRLCKWSFDLRHQRHLVDRWPSFDYDLRISNHGISKISYIICIMKSSKMIVWSRWDCLPLVFEEIDSMNEIRWKPWPT